MPGLADSADAHAACRMPHAACRMPHAARGACNMRRGEGAGRGAFRRDTRRSRAPYNLGGPGMECAIWLVGDELLSSLALFLLTSAFTPSSSYTFTPAQSQEQARCSFQDYLLSSLKVLD